jgi:pyruvate/2-oxoglutarate dehydrogenase complex dihydrolipoamide dehydrogenase (E3) component/uncharacterized membrane protein YdjX (TVP38/TMEM64 family)
VNRRKALVLAAIALAVAAFFALGGPRYLTFQHIKAHQESITSWYGMHPWATVAIFFAAYVAVTGLSLPGAAIMTLVAGAIFGLLWGTIIVSFASSIGATIAFLASRFLLRDWVQARFGGFLRSMNEGIKREGGLYLFSLRLIPVVPFFAINLAMGLTQIKARTFYWVSQLGMLLGTLVYVNAGTQLSRISTVEDILSAKLVGAFVLLGLFPLIAKRVVAAVKAHRVYGPWRKPAKFDRNLIVIGAGSAGLVSAYVAAAVKAKVTLIEKHRMGGDCLYTGCVPSKALIRSAKLLSQIKGSARYGIRHATAQFDFAEVMERIQGVIRAIEPHDSADRYGALGVECIRGEAKITSPWSVEIATPEGTKSLSTRAIIIAAGARPYVPPIPGLETIDVLTSDTVWQLRTLPKRLVVLGGGPIGSELAQAFARFGARVTQVELLPRILSREDSDVSEMVRRQFQEDGVDVLVGHKALRVESGADKTLVCEHDGGEVRIPFDALLCAVGRVPNTAGYGLEALGVPVSEARTVETNEYLQTLYPNIYACGDVAGPYQFTHTASHQAWYAAVNALFGGVRKFRADYSVIPWATFTDPEVARVGLNEAEARERQVAYEATTYGLDDLDRAIADGEARGMVKVLTVPGSDRVLGATIVGEHAADLIVEFIAAMKHRIGLNKILGTIHIYPTLSEANKYAAGAWKRAHAPQGLLKAVEKFHAWMRG